MRYSLVLATLMLSFLAGCVPISKHKPDAGEAAESGAVELVWVEKGIRHEDVEVDLGYQINVEEGVRWLEPFVVITRDGAPVPNAMVFNSLVSSGESDMYADEVATVYARSPSADMACYSQGKLRLPDGNSEQKVRFRIVLPSSEEAWTNNMTVRVQ